MDELKTLEEEFQRNRVKLRGVNAILVYGSYARQDNDELSDIDIFVMMESSSEKKLAFIEKEITRTFELILPNRKLDISIYEKARFENLLECGSLFLHHIEMEGKIIYAVNNYKNKKYLFGKLKDFKGISEDILLYCRMLDKVKQSIQEHDINYFDLNILSTLARNTYIVISYYKGSPKYGKWDSYNECSGEREIISKEIYAELLNYRIFYNRKTVKIELPIKERCNEYINQVEELLKWAKNQIGIHDSVDRLYYLLKDTIGRNLYTSYEIFTDFERDIYFRINRYCVKMGLEPIASLTNPFIEEFIEKFPDDELVICASSLLIEVELVKKNSSNYSIDMPDVYSEVKIEEKWIEDMPYLIRVFIEKVLNRNVEKKLNLIDYLEQFRQITQN